MPLDSGQKRPVSYPSSPLHLVSPKILQKVGKTEKEFDILTYDLTGAPITKAAFIV